MFKRYFLIVMTLLLQFVVSAKGNDDNAVSVLIDSLSLPSTAKVAAESRGLIVFTNVDHAATSDDEQDIVTLWVYWRHDGKLLKLLTTNSEEEYSCIGYGDKARKVSLTSIPTVSSVYINSDEDKLLVEGFDIRNGYAYIISLSDGLPTIQLPCSMGILGLSSEDDLIVAQSYEYYKHGGRYNVISVFDWNGNCLRHMNLKNVRSDS